MGSKGHVKVSTSDLEAMATQLKRLQSEFEDAKGVVDGFTGAMGSGEVAGKLDDFATNWNIHRKALCSQIELLGKTAEGAAKTYDGVDDHLAKALEKAYSGAKKSEG